MQELQDVIDHQLALYIISGLLLVVGYIFKKSVNRIEKNYDKHVEEQHNSNKELWVEVNNLRERMAKMEGKADV